VSQITLDPSNDRINTCTPDVLLAGRHDLEARTSLLAHTAAPVEWQDSDKPYELVTVCLWSVVMVSLTALLMWLAPGGEL